MKRHDVQNVELAVPFDRAFAYLADPCTLPEWTEAFASASDGGAVLRTPSGEVAIRLDVRSSPEHGTVDWHMTFPDGSVGAAYSRIVPLIAERCVFTFVLTAPPVPLEQIEGALDAQSRTLAKELRALKRRLESVERV